MVTKKKGITLVLALIILLILTLFGTAIMMLSVNKKQLIGNQMERIRSLSYAKAGVSEAIRRLSLDPSDSLCIRDPNEPYDSAWRIFILLTANPPADNPPVYYTSSVQISLPDTQRLNYTTENIDPNYSLVIHHKIVQNDPSEIFYYNWENKTEESHDPSTYNGAFFPIEVIEATGRDRNVRRKIKVEVERKSDIAAYTITSWNEE